MAYVRTSALAPRPGGGPIHYTFQEPWLRGLAAEKTYFWPFFESMIYSNRVKDYAELVKTAPAMSLEAQGWLDKPCAPMWLNGAERSWISPQEIPLLIETGNPRRCADRRWRAHGPRQPRERQFRPHGDGLAQGSELTS